jgi:hypothetical protein
MFIGPFGRILYTAFHLNGRSNVWSGRLKQYLPIRSLSLYSLRISRIDLGIGRIVKLCLKEKKRKRVRSRPASNKMLALAALVWYVILYGMQV